MSVCRFDRYFGRLVAALTVAVGAVGLYGSDAPCGGVRHDDIRHVVDAAGQLQAIDRPVQWFGRVKAVRACLADVMGALPDRSELPALDVREIETTEGPGYTRQTLTFVSEGVDRVPADLYFPLGRQEGERRPAILALHPTGPLGKRITAGEGPRANRGYAKELAERGYVVIAPDYPSFGDYKYNFETDPHASGTIKGIWNHMRAVDLLVSRPEVDPERIGVIGHSLGGHNGIFVAFFDPRIQAVVTSCGWTPFHHYYGGNLKGWTGPRYMPLIAETFGSDPDRVPFDFHELIAGLAPRPFLSISPERDSNFDVAGVRKAMPEVQRIYAVCSAADRAQVLYPDCDHDFPPTMRLAAYEFLDRWLKFEPRQTPPLK